MTATAVQDPIARDMLTLAAISYRGYGLSLPEPAKSILLHRAMNALLRTLEPVRDKWEIVWGPASFNAFLSGFDDAALYVAQSREHPGQFAVVVRGTNPVSLFDWVFGDLMVTGQVPWPYGTGVGADAQMSFSTALGLSVLQRLRWEPVEPSLLTHTWDVVGATARALVGNATGSASRLATDVRSRLRALRGLLAAPPHPAPRRTFQPAVDSLEERVAETHRRWTQMTTGGTLRALTDALALAEGAELDPLRLVLGGTRLQQALGSGVDVRSFLAAIVDQARQPIEIFVTGHSKGGALCSTLALWLADTQGDGVPAAHQWDPQRKASVHAYSFAGPTAGNGAFVEHSNGRIGADCHLIVNTNDVVPQAWVPRLLREIPGKYGLRGPQKELLRGLVEAVGARVDARNYQHLGDHVTEFAGELDPRKPFVAQAVDQHLDAYLRHMGLAEHLTTDTLFSPVPH